MVIDKKTVGQRIKNIRKKYGYSMQKFGEMIDNAPKGSVNSWEKGVNLPNDKRLQQIALLGNISINELLYGSFENYVNDLIEEKLGVHLPETFSYPLHLALQKGGYTYGDDIEIIRLMNGFFAYHNFITKETVIFYQPTSYSDSYFDGIIQKGDYSTLVCRAYSEKDKNTMHILPFFTEEKNEEGLDFFHAFDKLELPHKHNYFTSGIITLDLNLRDSKIIYYGIDNSNYEVQIQAYKFLCEKDAYIFSNSLDYTLNAQFYREVKKESVFLKHQSGTYENINKQEDL